MSPDTGSFDIPAPLVTALVKLGAGGLPQRLRDPCALRMPPTGEPGAKLSMPSRGSRSRSIPASSLAVGLNSPPCPSGMTCDDNLKIYANDCYDPSRASYSNFSSVAFVLAASR